MARIRQLTPQFVRSAPDQLETGILYVSMEFGSVIHLCCCGCGREVVTPLSPKDWKLISDGDSITLYPSIGNWSSCRSHYWIRNNQVIWARDMSDEEIWEGRKYDRANRTGKTSAPKKKEPASAAPPENPGSWKTFFNNLFK